MELFQNIYSGFIVFIMVAIGTLLFAVYCVFGFWLYEKLSSLFLSEIRKFNKIEEMSIGFSLSTAILSILWIIGLMVNK